MSYVANALHPTATVTIKRPAATATGAGGKLIPGTPTTVGSFLAAIEDLDQETTLRLVSGRAARIHFRVYADADEDLPVLRGDVAEFTDPSTSEARALEVINRRGPFDATDDEDHFELELASEQGAG